MSKDRDNKKGLFHHRKNKDEIVDNVDDTYIDNDFINLDDLVYAPLEALAESDVRLQRSVLDAIRELGEVKNDGENSVIHLSNTNIAYEQLKSEQDESCSVENIQLQVPTLSLVPISSLNIKKAEVKFSTEVRVTSQEDNGFKINARICSKEQRGSDFLPRVSYKMNVESVPATEGLMRIMDLLNTSQVAKQLDAKPLTPSGNVQTDEMKELYNQKQETKTKISMLQRLHDSIAERVLRVENMDASLDEDMSEEISEKLKYLKNMQAEILKEIMELELALTDKDIEGCAYEGEQPNEQDA